MPLFVRNAGVPDLTLFHPEAVLTRCGGSELTTIQYLSYAIDRSLSLFDI
jgi:hypothetical protein